MVRLFGVTEQTPMGALGAATRNAAPVRPESLPGANPDGGGVSAVPRPPVSRTRHGLAAVKHRKAVAAGAAFAIGRSTAKPPAAALTRLARGRI
ncbi:hypothetical protein ACPCUK_35810 [Streptomyces arboris]|uniref:hypothetical protein n=1 Tax=Streptomyces arboris TaxID=2600619 RepID=UPI003C2EAB6B